MTTTDIVTAVLAGDCPLAIALDYAQDHLGAWDAESARAALTIAADDAGLIRQWAEQVYGRYYVTHLARDGQTIAPVDGERWLVVAGTVTIDGQLGGHVWAYGTARLVSRGQQGGWVWAHDSARLLSRDQRGGDVQVYNTARLLSRDQRGGHVWAGGTARLVSRGQRGGEVSAAPTATLIEKP